MEHWISIEEGSYYVDEGFLVNPGNAAVALDEATMEVFLSGNVWRRVRGRGLAFNMQIVELLEDHDDIDVLLDLGGEFKYLLETPLIRGGRILSPDVKGTIHFTAQSPVRKLLPDEYAEIKSQLTLVGR